MNPALRRLSYVVVAMVVSLLAMTSYVQVFQADSLRANENNNRVTIEEYDRQRGRILAGGTVLADSVATGGQYDYLRQYPNDLGAVFAPVTGFYSLVYLKAGLEYAEDQLLTGNDDRLFGRRFIDTLAGRDPRGGNVVTTIDPNLQKVAYDAMQAGCSGGCRGSVVAIEPQTGKILAMVSTPSYDPNPLASHDTAVGQQAWDQLQADPNQPMLNRALASTYPPGSTFKVITTAAALQSGLDTDTRLTAASSITLPGTSTDLTNYGGSTCPGGSNGMVTLEQAFAASCNTAFVDLATNQIPDGEEALVTTAGAFGLNASVDNIPLRVADSVTGDIDNPAVLGQSAIGQSNVRVTPLQNAMIAATIANGCVRMQPYLVDSLQDPDLSELSHTDPRSLGQACSPEVARSIQDLMLESERHTRGSGGPVSIASKTGTAEHSDGRSDEAPHAWYIAYGPTDTARIAVAVIVEDGGDAGQAATGGSVAAPIGRAVINAAVGAS